MKNVAMISLTSAVIILSWGRAFSLQAEEISAAIVSRATAYKVSIQINGHDVGITGGKAETRTLFTHGHSLQHSIAAQSRATAAQLFVLRPGANDITIHFEKIPPKIDRFELTLSVDSYPGPIYSLVTDRLKGDIHQSFQLHADVPATFRPIFQSAMQSGTAGYVYLGSRGCTLNARVLGEDIQGNLTGLPGLIALVGLRSGDNAIRVNYTCDSAIPDIQFSIGASGLAENVVRQAPGEEHKETFHLAIR